MKNIVVRWKAVKDSLTYEFERIYETIKGVRRSIAAECGQCFDVPQVDQAMFQLFGERLKIHWFGIGIPVPYGNPISKAEEDWPGTIRQAEELLEICRGVSAEQIRNVFEGVMV